MLYTAYTTHTVTYNCITYVDIHNIHKDAWSVTYSCIHTNIHMQMQACWHALLSCQSCQSHVIMYTVSFSIQQTLLVMYTYIHRLYTSAGWVATDNGHQLHCIQPALNPWHMYTMLYIAYTRTCEKYFLLQSFWLAKDDCNCTARATG